jgi:hypothetical protein
MPGNFEKALTGFNHNIKHKGKVYHVQTEDSGVSNPHIITHLFVGGNIVASKRTSYADIVGAEHLQEIIRELMEEQHKEMLRNLIGGAFDEVASTEGSTAPDSAPLSKPEAETSPAAHAPVTAAPKPLPKVAANAQVKREARVETLFGEDLISEKSLDEVILSYLAGEGDQ